MSTTGDQVKQTEEEVKKGLFHTAKAWGDSSLPPTLLATLITPLYIRPFKPLPMLFPPVLLFTSYLNLNGYTKDAAGLSAAWSGIYMLLASRRKHRVVQKFGARGLIRGATFGVAAANLIAGGVSFTFGRRDPDE